MYLVDDKKSAVRDVQRFLLVIGQRGEIPHLSVDGVYSDETKDAVRAFQRNKSLNITGTVDRETFDAIYSEYLVLIESDIYTESEFDEGVFPMKLGDSGNSVSVLNALLRELSRFYRDLPLSYGDFYSQNTAAAVRLVQRYFRQEETGETSKSLYNEIKNKLTSVQK